MSRSRPILFTLAICIGCPGVRAETPDAFQFFQEESQVITASLQPVLRQQAPATVYVVTQEDIQNSGATTVWDALRNVPGVDVVQTRTDQAEVSIRGLDQVLNNRTLVLLDGKTVLNGFFDFVTWESLPVTLDQIDRIEIVEGPASAVYGANAISGVINIITKTPEQLRGGRLRYTAGERNTQQGSFVYGRQTDQVGYRLGGGWNSMNQFQDSGRFASEAGKFDSLLNYRFTSDSELSLSGGVTRLNTETTTGAAGTAFDKGLVSFARADYRYAETRLRTFWNHGRTSLDEFSFPPNVNLDYDTYDAELTQSVALPFRQQAVFGTSYRRNSARSASFAPGLLEQDLWSAFLEDNWQMADRWSLLASGRLDRHPFTPLMFSPRGSLIYTPVPEHTFRASAGTAFRNPTLTENYIDLTLNVPNGGSLASNPPFTGVQSQTLGNRNLDPERVESIELAHSGTFGRLKTTLTAFHYRLNDVIQNGGATVVSAAPPVLVTQSSYINSPGTLRAWGGEAGLDLVMSSRLSSFANYSYQYLHDDSVAQLAPRQSPRHKANAGLRGKSGGVAASLWTNWVDRTVWPSGVNGGNPAPVSAYFLVNLHLGYSFSGRWSGLEAGVTDFNLLNHDHYEILPAQNALTPGQNGEIVRSRWTGTVSYKF